MARKITGKSIDAIRHIEKVVSFLFSRIDYRFIYLIGSRARGDATSKSAWDFVIDAGKPLAWNFFFDFTTGICRYCISR